MLKGQWIHVRDIKKLVRKSYPLTAADWKPHDINTNSYKL